MLLPGRDEWTSEGLGDLAAAAAASLPAVSIVDTLTLASELVLLSGLRGTSVVSAAGC